MCKEEITPLPPSAQILEMFYAVPEILIPFAAAERIRGGPVRASASDACKRASLDRSRAVSLAGDGQAAAVPVQLDLADFYRLCRRRAFNATLRRRQALKLSTCGLLHSTGDLNGFRLAANPSEGRRRGGGQRSANPVTC